MSDIGKALMEKLIDMDAVCMMGDTELGAVYLSWDEMREISKYLNSPFPLSHAGHFLGYLLGAEVYLDLEAA